MIMRRDRERIEAAASRPERFARSAFRLRNKLGHGPSGRSPHSFPQRSSPVSCGHPLKSIGVGIHARRFVRRSGKQPKPVAVMVLGKAGAVTAHERVAPPTATPRSMCKGCRWLPISAATSSMRL
jgi:hypothetical protein